MLNFKKKLFIGIDLGSNTLRICAMDESLNIFLSDEIVTGVARGLKAGDALNLKAKDLIINSLLKFKSKFDFTQNNYRAVATEAFRIARDSDEFFAEIFAKTAIKFELISGDIEAYLTRLAIDSRLKKLNFSSHNTLSIDMGDASSELVCNKMRASFKFGIISFADNFKSNFQNALLVTNDARDFTQGLKFDKIVLNSGVPTTIAAIKIGMNYADYDPNLINGTCLKFDDFAKIRTYLTKISTTMAENLVGKNRVKLIISGIFLLEALLQKWRDLKIIVVDDGLREGVCIEYFLKNSSKIQKTNIALGL